MKKILTLIIVLFIYNTANSQCNNRYQSEIFSSVDVATINTVNDMNAVNTMKDASEDDVMKDAIINAMDDNHQ